MYYAIDKQHYPTPEKLAFKMFDKLDKKTYKKVLEPSAGKGDLIESFLKWHRSRKAKVFLGRQEFYLNTNNDPKIDAVEIDTNLIALLRGKNYRVVGYDFLEFNTFEKYDLIIMNPPFRYGAEHLLKAIELLEDGGEIVCILNAETLRNDYTEKRKVLKDKLEKYEASIEYIEEAFLESERKTDVEIAVVYLNIPQKESKSRIFDNLKKDYQQRQATEKNELRERKNEIDTLIDYYNLEVNSLLTLIEEYFSLQNISLIDTDLTSTIKLNCVTYNNLALKQDELINECLRLTRIKYWKHLFASKSIATILTSSKKEELDRTLNKFGDYEFNKFNVLQLRSDLFEQLVSNVDESIMKMFDYLSQEFSLEKTGNIHYFNGWKTNKSWKIGKKVILPLYAMDNWGSGNIISLNAIEKLSDVFKALAYLDGKTFDYNSMNKICELAESNQQFKNVELEYAKLDFYKKGTVHIKFTDKTEQIRGNGKKLVATKLRKEELQRYDRRRESSY